MPVADALRILAVFSQPAATDVLALRKERYELSRLIRTLAARHRAAIELRVVQYGTTRERLKQIADDGDGWDVLHLSGHGGGGAFLLEHPDGSPDLVPAADLVTLLHPARRRVKLAVVSACESAADATAQTYRLLGLTDQAAALEAESQGPVPQETAAHEGELHEETAPEAEGGSTSAPAGTSASAPGSSPASASANSPGRPDASIPGLAKALVRDLGCPVVAMRYPVADAFAIAYTSALYDQLLAHRKPLDQAAAHALAEATAQAPSLARPPLSIATPAIYLGRLRGDRAEQRVHRLAAALLYRLSGMAHDLANAVRALAGELRADGSADPSLPSTLAQVIALAEQTEGVHLSALLAALQPDEAKIEAALSEILTAATTPPT